MSRSQNNKKTIKYHQESNKVQWLIKNKRVRTKNKD